MGPLQLPVVLHPYNGWRSAGGTNGSCRRPRRSTIPEASVFSTDFCRGFLSIGAAFGGAGSKNAQYLPYFFLQVGHVALKVFPQQQGHFNPLAATDVRHASAAVVVGAGFNIQLQQQGICIHLTSQLLAIRWKRHFICRHIYMRYAVSKGLSPSLVHNTSKNSKHSQMVIHKVYILLSVVFDMECLLKLQPLNRL